MRKTFHKLFWIWELDKEEAWINEMASHGYSLVYAGRLTYVFEETEPDLYTYKTLFLKGSAGSKENTDYMRFLEEMGIETVTTSNYPGTCWVSTRAKKADYPNGIDLYSDIDSKIKYMKVSFYYLIFALVALTLVAALNISIGLQSANSLSFVNLAFGIAVAVLTIICMIELIRTGIGIAKLKKERNIHE